MDHLADTYGLTPPFQSRQSRTYDPMNEPAERQDTQE
jgi:hypothetical protein